MAGPSITTVGLVADTHGAIDARIVAQLAACDLAVHAGDIGAASVLQGIAALGIEVMAVRGNNDTEQQWLHQMPLPELQQSLAVLNALPEELLLDLPGGPLLVVHGHRTGPASRRHQWLRQHYPEARAIVYGHSHRLLCDTARRPWVLNPGAAGRRRTFGGPSCLILSATPRQWHLRSVRFPCRASA